ncbi:MAG: 5-carboxymethyl-2-hydroxymuconate isomerase [Deltaproteobacteria bacterium HGW-Deltaproteobacteria-19]|nr:MAG: 5-carboxymethyl-2-hydroxymuconate isomerase [Deltaproteobacteria bacterium HGW-Deltaproteobacteria-19]
MKIIRFADPEGRIDWGMARDDRTDEAWVLKGDLFGGFEVGVECRPVRRLLCPLAPPNILALGINYRQHGDEFAMSYPEQPVLFLKATTSLIGPGEPILLPRAGAEHVDYEAELAVVIGRRAKNVTPGEAMEYVLGYSCANDVSARDWQIEKQKGQWARGKSFDTFCPLGPWLVTRDEVEDPGNLRIRCLVNGQALQDASTADMIFPVASIVSNLSLSMTLEPGTVILTGTPQGVGFTRKPPIFLHAGDTVSVEIERIGTLTNPVFHENVPA